MKTKLAQKIGIGILSLASLVGCGKEEPKITADALISTDKNSIVEEINKYHNGIQAIGYDRDFDRDKINDFYIIGKDGIIFYNPSTEKSRSIERSIEVWYKDKTTDPRFNQKEDK